MSEKPLKIEKYINDNVYGGIGFTKNEFRIINTRTFQRLRRIKQQGLNSFTFPSAEHTRFSHSLGVLHIMGKITQTLVEQEKIDFQTQKILRYAALLHDIGHYPLSHLTEWVYNTLPEDKSKEPLHNEKIFQNPLERFSSKPDSKHAHHEKLGHQVLKHRNDIKSILEAD